MSIPVELADLRAEASTRPYAYLLTVSDDGRPHSVAVQPAFDGGALLADVGGRTQRNVGARPLVALVWPPVEAGGYSLIVDCEGAVEGESAVRLSPTKAVLHRPAPANSAAATGEGVDAAEAGSCGSDCVAVPLT